MLARRVVIGPAAIIRRGSQIQKRFIHPLRSQLQAPPRPNTWLAKIRFRVDGKPRSKLIALGFGSLILSNLILLRAIYGVIEKEEIAGDLFVRIIYLQRTDSTYDSVNFDDPIATLSYFKRLYQNFLQSPDEVVDKYFKDMMKLFKLRGGLRTKEGSTNSAEVQAQHIMRSAAEKVHIAFQESNKDSFVVFEVINEAFGSLLGLMHDCISDDDSSS